jgi:hypothetical protein
MKSGSWTQAERTWRGGWEGVAHVGHETLDSIVLKRPRVVRDEAAVAEGVN